MEFPPDFLWGAATAAYQIEGAVNEDGRGPSIWDTFCRRPRAVYHGDTGDNAADHYHRLDADLDLMAGLGLRAYRFSVSWPRIQPGGRGPANQRGLDFYRRLVDGLLARNIVPMLTLYHWDLPQALEDAGGWPVRETAERFADYAGLLFEALDDRVPLWITLNEPWVSAWKGYGSGEHAPGRRDPRLALAAAHHQLLGHGLARQAFRARGSSGSASRIGITVNLAPMDAASPAPEDLAAARLMDGNQNRWFLDAVFRGDYPADMRAHYGPLEVERAGDRATIGGAVDFLGINFYMRHVVRAAAVANALGIAAATAVPPGLPTTRMGWGISPEALTEVLVRVARDYPALPLYITENGAAFDDYVDPEGEIDDEERCAFLDAHLRAVHAARAAGVDVRGYFVWSLMDNFEWAWGYARRFGLVFVDYATQRRWPKRSADWYARVIRANALPAARPAPWSPADSGL